MKLGPLLFVSFENHLAAGIPGGVQICTQEYIGLLKAWGFEVFVKGIPFTHNLLKRLSLKIGLNVYEGFDFKKISEELIFLVRKHGIKVVAINQVSLAGVASYLKKDFGNSVKILLLSHGNESGDFLHEVALEKPGVVIAQMKLWRLGAFLAKESQYFRNDIDAVLCLSETEQHINNWLGAKRTFFIPRIYRPEFLPWNPVRGRMGFVGTLNHLPNYEGLQLFLKELSAITSDEVHVRVVGGPVEAGKSLQKKFSFVEYLGKLDSQALETEASSWGFFLNPVFWYSRGASTKLAQGINWGLPIISTPAGNRGYTINSSQLLTVYSPKEMAEKSVYYLSKEELLSALSQETRIIASHGPTHNQLKNLIFPELFIDN